ncbi:bifunctional cytidylyltransferase/SDR family oxidoreductase [Pseudarthrobacter sp. NamE2]|uniref:bifunctional cytidylyltransferase/SDR family oxidoreductase n=1 Tax=Pseudarthrobacter sp. NamE2 TaxID=2576838 RepID=UPI0010FDA40D|nr:bifunctional cytidylyltransferase/SDR family oxidoreductase [Pseudarthrobacter sp. NamE2]TLM84500.1 bifunctional cytidylyltransferase/SDR family oxidoreductase [Pseudarthrobacter sp. NamE2]
MDLQPPSFPPGTGDARHPQDTARRRNAAVILAGGVGARMGLDIPKQFVPIAGRTSLEHTVELFQSCELVDQIIVMMAPGYIPKAAELLLEKRGRGKITAILPGGADRSATSRLALDAIADKDANVIFHDAVRPLLDPDIIGACIRALDIYGAVDTAIPSADTIVEVDEDNFIRAVPPRAKLRRGQTPQAFRMPVIAQAYERAVQDPDFAATDDCSVVLKYCPDVPIFVVDGDDANIKITQPIDIHIADKLFQLKHKTALPGGSTEGLRNKVVVVFGASSGIGLELVQQLEAEGALVVGQSRSGSGTFVEDRHCVVQALADAAAAYGRVDHVILTAGVLSVGPLARLTDEQLHHDVDVNLTAAFIVAQESQRYLDASKGSLTLFASSSYTRGRANYTVYSATKAAIVNLTQALADEWSADGIRVNCISPSRTATPMRTRAFGEEDEGSLLPAAAVAGASIQVLASAMTGQVVDVRLPYTDPTTDPHLVPSP